METSSIQKTENGGVLGEREPSNCVSGEDGICLYKFDLSVANLYIDTRKQTSFYQSWCKAIRALLLRVKNALSYMKGTFSWYVSLSLSLSVSGISMSLHPKKKATLCYYMEAKYKRGFLYNCHYNSYKEVAVRNVP